MADRKPLKVTPDGGGDSTGLGEFVAADTIGIVDGGTGADSAGAALTALGASPVAGSSSVTTLGTIATGTWEATDIAVAHGGTGASDASTARSNLGITDTTPGGSDTQVQYNNSSAFGGSTNLTFDGSVLKVRRDDTSVNHTLEIEQDGTGDASLQFHLTGVQGWYAGIDNSASDTFYINTGAGNTGNGINITTAGNVGIGTASVDQLLHIEESSGGDKEMQFQIENTGIGDAAMTFKIAAQSYSMGVDNNAGDIFVISSSDNLEDNQAFGIDGNGVIAVKTDKASSHTFNIHNTTASNPSGMQIYFGGVSSGDTTDYFSIAGDTGGTRAVHYSNGQWGNATDSYGSIVSERRLKQDITGARSYWDDFKQLEYSKFRFISDVESDPDAHYQLGLMVDNVETIFPSLVTSTPERKMQDVPVLDDDGEATYEQVEKLDSDGNAETDNDGNIVMVTIPVTEEKFVTLDTATKGIKSSIVNGAIMGCVVQELQTRLEAAEAKIAALESA